MPLDQTTPIFLSHLLPLSLSRLVRAARAANALASSAARPLCTTCTSIAAGLDACSPSVCVRLF